jgi:hypothetical protein
VSRPLQPAEPGRCLHDLPDGQCGDARCRPDGQPLEVTDGPDGPVQPVPCITTMTARWPGECSNCGDAFEADTTIGVHVVAAVGRCGRGAYVCARCIA